MRPRRTAAIGFTVSAFFATAAFPVVVAAEMDIAHVAQEATAGRVHQCVQKLELGHRRRRQRDVRGGVLDDVRASQDVLNFREMRGHNAKRLR